MSTRILPARPELRKEPRQARSKATVEAIVEAGARILAEDGWAGFTTNKIAALAGASIGSLYQYFPDKTALIDAIRRRHLDECLSALSAVTSGDRTLDAFAEDLVDALIAAHSSHPRLHRILLDEAPSPETFRDPNSEFERAYIGCYLLAVAGLRPQDGEEKNRIVALTLSDALDGVIHNAARRGTLGSLDMRSELVRLVKAYLEEPKD